MALSGEEPCLVGIWRAILDVSGHWEEFIVVPIGRSVRPPGIHMPSDTQMLTTPDRSPDE